MHGMMAAIISRFDVTRKRVSFLKKKIKTTLLNPNNPNLTKAIHINPKPNQIQLKTNQSNLYQPKPDRK
jgi:hypothetical protein